MLYYNKIPELIQRKDSKHRLIPFSFEAISKSSGDIIKGEGCICTSSYIKTVNIQWPSGEVRKLRKILFIKVNDIEIIA